MIKLQAKFGYLIHNKVTDTYSRVVYMPDSANLDDFEEVRDDTVDARLIAKMEEVEQKEQSLTKVARIVANQVTDDVVALEIQEFYDEWQVGISYMVGQYVRYKDVLYKVLSDHTSQEAWTPSESPSLFAKVLIDPAGAILDWEQPDSTNPYMKGDKVMFDGKVYESEIDNNVWQPGVYGWKEVI